MFLAEVRRENMYAMLIHLKWLYALGFYRLSHIVFLEDQRFEITKKPQQL
jgi:hypothetical protein